MNHDGHETRYRIRRLPQWVLEPVKVIRRPYIAELIMASGHMPASKGRTYDCTSPNRIMPPQAPCLSGRSTYEADPFKWQFSVKLPRLKTLKLFEANSHAKTAPDKDQHIRQPGKSAARPFSAPRGRTPDWRPKIGSGGFSNEGAAYARPHDTAGECLVSLRDGFRLWHGEDRPQIVTDDRISLHARYFSPIRCNRTMRRYFLLA